MNRELLYTRNDGATDLVILEIIREGRWYAGYATMGTVRKKILSGYASQEAAYGELVKSLVLYKEDLID